MPRSNWVIAATFGLIFFPASGYAQETQGPSFESNPVSQVGQNESSAEGDQAASDQLNIAADLAPFLQGIESAIRESVAGEDQAERQRQQEYEERDLNAQEEMALWAKGMFWATVAAVVLTFAALIAIIRTLHHTRIAAEQSVVMADQAKLATKAAQDAIAVTNRLGEAQVRAYLSITEVTAIIVGIDTDAVLLDFRISMQNGGQSPARDVRAKIEGRGVIPTDAMFGLGTIAANSELQSQAITVGFDPSKSVTPFGDRQAISIQVSITLIANDVFGTKIEYVADFIGKTDVNIFSRAALSPLNHIIVTIQQT